MKTEHGFANLCGRTIYTTLYIPDVPARRAVVMCEPFADEKRCAFRMIVRLSEKLAEAGVAVMRFDVSGTGDSAASHADAEWDNWCEETVAAVNYIKRRTGAGECRLMGFRSGAILAAYAASKVQCSAVSLVEPILTGATLLKDLEMRQGIQSVMNAKAMTNDGTAETVEDKLPEGFKEFAGFVVNPRMTEQLSKADLLSFCGQLKGTSIQLIRVSGGKNFPPNWKPLVDLATASDGGEAIIIADKPFWGQVDYFESDAVINPLLKFTTGQDAL
ncbi:MAG: hypothetical protein IJS15_16160 [Victivallales bacterium]|nr:hypothetical protein [Victivallales bacterium]